MESVVAGYLDWNDMWDSVANAHLADHCLQNQLEQGGQNHCFSGQPSN